MAIDVTLPNGQVLTVDDAQDPQQAAAAARLYFERNHPEAFREWAKTLPRGSFGQSFSHGIDTLQGNLYGAAEAVGKLS